MKSSVFAARRTGNSRWEVGWRSGFLGLMAFAALAFTSASAEAQTGQVTGTVVDAQSSAPLGEVQVFLVGESLGGLSRSDGRFLILNVPVGSYELRAERIGYAPQVQTVQVTAASTTTVDFRMASQALGLDEIVVTGTAGGPNRAGESLEGTKEQMLSDRSQDADPLIEVRLPRKERDHAREYFQQLNKGG